jgi:hypothetical protein
MQSGVRFFILAGDTMCPGASVAAGMEAARKERG